MSERTEELKNVSVEDMVNKLHKEKSRIIEEFTKAYLAETGVMPSEIEFVTQQMPTIDGIIEHRYFFRRKTS